MHVDLSRERPLPKSTSGLASEVDAGSDDVEDRADLVAAVLECGAIKCAAVVARVFVLLDGASHFQSRLLCRWEPNLRHRDVVKLRLLQLIRAFDAFVEDDEALSSNSSQGVGRPPSGEFDVQLEALAQRELIFSEPKLG